MIVPESIVNQCWTIKDTSEMDERNKEREQIAAIDYYLNVQSHSMNNVHIV